jgi:hypothetical protein
MVASGDHGPVLSFFYRSGFAGVSASRAERIDLTHSLISQLAMSAMRVGARLRRNVPAASSEIQELRWICSQAKAANVAKCWFVGDARLVATEIEG